MRRLVDVWTLCAQHPARLKVARVIVVAFSRSVAPFRATWGRNWPHGTDQSIDRAMDGAGRPDRIDKNGSIDRMGRVWVAFMWGRGCAFGIGSTGHGMSNTDIMHHGRASAREARAAKTRTTPPNPSECTRMRRRQLSPRSLEMGRRSFGLSVALEHLGRAGFGVLDD